MSDRDEHQKSEKRTSISRNDDYFYRMLSPKSLELTGPYHAEESSQLELCLRKNTQVQNMNFVAVGGGELWELRRALRYTKRYVCIEPLADMYMNDSVKYLIERLDTISVIPKRFNDVARGELPAGGCFFMFLFNVLAYIENPIEVITEMTRPGDIVFISTWADTTLARALRKEYFAYIDGSERELADFATFPFEKCERIKGAITDILVIHI